MAFPDYEPTTPAFLRSIVERFGDDPLVVLDEERASYAEIEARSARLARALLARGMGKGSRVGVLLPNGPDWIASTLAITRIGAIAVPLNTFFQTRELAWMLRHSDVQLLLCAAGFLNHDYLTRLEEAAPGLSGSPLAPLRIPSLPYLREIWIFGESDRSWSRDARHEIESAGGDSAIDDDFLAAVEANVTPADPMMILYSSGSTADPKGTVHSHGAVIRHSHNLLHNRDLRSDDRIWTPMPFFWVGGFVFSLLGVMHSGACILLEEAFEPGRTLEFLERERATIAAGWPHFGQAMANHPSAKERDFSSLRLGNIPTLLPESVMPADPERRPNALGMTETCGQHTWLNDGPLPKHLRGSHGVPVAGLEHRIVDPETGEIAPPGELGEIHVRGYSLLQGLYKVEREDTYEPDGFYRTGDGGTFSAEGILYFKGRLGDMIKTAGANVTPSEVEAVLATFDEVKAAYVVGVPHPDRGQDVAASVLLESGATTAPDELRVRLKGQISAYKVPRHLFIDQDEALPFTDSGKIDKRALSELLANRIGG
jgi:acyl-CoA synthetase (AMP-forming)/AMP-acid ligase II